MKSLLQTLGLSCILFCLLMLILYSFQMSLLNVSNSLFIVGILMFFPAFISVTGASKVFESSHYLTHKVFAKKGEETFKSLEDYKHYRETKNKKTHVKNKSIERLIMGIIYIVASVVIGFC